MVELVEELSLSPGRLIDTVLETSLAIYLRYAAVLESQEVL